MKKVELAGAVILDNRKILLMHRDTEELKQWELPGGKMESGESPEQTARRELYEELGIEISIIKDLGFKEFESDGCILKYHWFVSKIESGNPTLKEEKFNDIKYFSKEELLECNELSSNMRTFIKTIDIELI